MRVLSIGAEIIRRKVFGENAARIWELDKGKAMKAKVDIMQKTQYA